MAEALHWLTLTEIAARYRVGDLSPVEVTRLTLERIARLEPKLHSFCAVTSDRAMIRARQAEVEIAAGRYRGPLHGIPLAVKDLCALKGTPTTAGMAILSRSVSSRDSTVVNRLEQAGAVIVGKLAMTEGAYATYHPTVTAPVNPWAADRWPGVSSSGSGVAVAAGLCYAALGSDTGGSIRFPSAACGVVGIKPTWGRVSRFGVFPLAASLDHVGPMARSVSDAAAVLQAISGFDANDLTSLRLPVPDYSAALPRGVRGLRIGVDEAFVREGMDGEIAAAVIGCLETFQKLGAEATRTRVPPTDDVLNAWTTITQSEAAAAHSAWFPERASEYGQELSRFLSRGGQLGGADYADAHDCRLKFKGALEGVFEGIDLLLCPSIGFPPPPINGDWGAARDGRLFMRFTAPFNCSGNPTISLPCGFTAAGLPISLQLVARHYEEDVLIAAARAFERGSALERRIPPLAQ